MEGVHPCGSERPCRKRGDERLSIKIAHDSNDMAVTKAKHYMIVTYRKADSPLSKDLYEQGLL